jgi:hypothetical protein
VGVEAAGADVWEGVPGSGEEFSRDHVELVVRESPRLVVAMSGFILLAAHDMMDSGDTL